MSYTIKFKDGSEKELTTLRHAELRYANLAGADLRDADLSSAHLDGALLFGAKLEGMKLGCADLSKALFNEVDLNGALPKEAQLPKHQN